MESPKSNGGPARMLVVDDDPRSRRLLEGFLLAERYHVRGAGDGPSALAAAAEETPDVVLLDVMMPGMTGHEVCRELKRRPETRLTQVMLVTALDGSDNTIEGLDTGADDYTTKPVRRDEFLAKVRALLRARRLLVDLDRARADLAARNLELQLKKTLAQTLVHDLKNPLSAILGNLELLELASSPETRPVIARSKNGAQRMLSMIVNLLDVERLEEGQLRPVTSRVDGAALVRDAAADAADAARFRKVSIAVETTAPVWIEADGALLRRVIDNLVANAVNHSPTGGTVTVRASGAGGRVEFEVLDQGPGIPAAFRQTVFEKYAQVGDTRERNSPNRGLGLTFCRLAVEAHGGSIRIDDAPGGGARFRTVLGAGPGPGDADASPACAVAGVGEPDKACPEPGQRGSR